jgi:hypothetical protein
MRDKDFGAVRLRAFGNYAYRMADPKVFHTEISGTRDVYTVADLDGQLRGLICRTSPPASRKAASLPGPGGQPAGLCAGPGQRAGAAMQAYGLKLEAMTVQSVSLPEELQKILDQKIGMGMVGGDMGKFMQYQTAQAIPKMAEGVARAATPAGWPAPAWAWAPAWPWARCWRRACSRRCRAARRSSAGTAAPAGVRPEDVMATLEKLGELKAKGILTDDEFNAKKAELLKKLV